MKVSKDKDIGNLVKKGIQKTLKNAGLNEDISKDIMDTRLNKIFDSGLFPKILIIQVDKFFGKMQDNILLIFCIILLIPTVEIIIAVRKNKKLITNLK